ncbi:MAG: ParB/RepB/Spo0J family partition protein [Deltaproteobacteria bacterium]|nr:MAG: ParB/RepB/Spo0J family partition protein [Deltaproteobacteria bacterium]
MGKKQSSVLGKGAAALFGKAPIFTREEPKEETQDGIMLVEVSEIAPNPNQPRKNFKEKELQELANSIKENGVLMPLLVSKMDKGFELIAGERRLKASKIAGLLKVPVIIKRATDKEKKIMAIIENVQRSDLNCVEEGLAYFNLIDEYKLTQEEVAKKLGKERSTIANLLRILKLPREVIDFLQKEVLTFGHAKVLASEEDRDIILRLANMVVVDNLSVRELEKLLKKERRTKKPVTENETHDDKMGSFRDNLEQKTGFHFLLNNKKNGSGQFVIKYNNEAEFNDIYDYLLKR